MTEVSRAGRRLGGREATTARIEGAYALAVGMPVKPAPPGWSWRLLTDLARLESGHTPSRKRPDYWGGDIPWVGIRDATGNHGRVLLSTNENTNELGIANSAARVLPTNTVCLSRTASVGYVVVMGRPMATSQDFVNWVCTDQLDHRFLKYALIAEGATLLRFASGSVHQTIYFPEVKSFYIALPPLAEQRSIAEVLGALDDKIGLNRQMNETLEEMVQSIFRDWFVEFGPVRRKMSGVTNPVEIMGGTVLDHTQASKLASQFPHTLGDDGPPAGWVQRPLDRVADFLNGLALQKFPATEGDPSLPAIKIAELRSGLTEKTDRVSRDVPGRYIVNDGDYIFSWSGTLMAKVWAEGEGALNQHLFKVTSAEYPQWFYATWVQHHLAEFQQIAASKATTMGHIQRAHLAAAMTLCPPPAAIEAMSSVIAPLWDLAIQNSVENRTLAEARNYLLPRLMSGEVRVREAEKAAASVLAIAS